MTDPRYRRWMRTLDDSRRRMQRFSDSDPQRLHQVAEDVTRLAEELLDVMFQADKHVTDLKASLQTERDRWMTLFASMPVACAATDNLGTILHANTMAAELLSLSAASLVGRSLKVFFVPRARFEQLQRDLAAAQPVAAQPLELRPRDRKPFPVVVTVIRVPSTPREWLWFIDDGTAAAANR